MKRIAIIPMLILGLGYSSHSLKAQWLRGEDMLCLHVFD